VGQDERRAIFLNPIAAAVGAPLVAAPDSVHLAVGSAPQPHVGRAAADGRVVPAGRRRPPAVTANREAEWPSTCRCGWRRFERPPNDPSRRREQWNQRSGVRRDVSAPPTFGVTGGQRVGQSQSGPQKYQGGQ